MKLEALPGEAQDWCVAPFTGAWIETRRKDLAAPVSRVAPFTGAWIETRNLRELARSTGVAPFTGAWIETLKTREGKFCKSGRTLHGCVD